MKRFLINEEAIIEKKFFDELFYFYDNMDNYKGYHKFYLHYKFECDSKIELFYKCLSIIKKLKNSKKLDSSTVDEALHKLQQLHNVPILTDGIRTTVNQFDLKGIYREILSLPKNEMTINGIAFGIDNTLEYFREDINGIKVITIIIQILNTIQRAAVDHTCENILALAEEKQLKHETIESIFLSENASGFFESYLEDYPYINQHKQCSKDITFEHFKNLYKIKKEPPRNK